MKRYLIAVALVFSGMIYAQDSKPVLEPFGKKVKATYFYDNGQVQQEGYFENGKLEGYWVSYNEDGTKNARQILANITPSVILRADPPIVDRIL